MIFRKMIENTIKYKIYIYIYLFIYLFIFKDATYFLFLMKRPRENHQDQFNMIRNLIEDDLDENRMCNWSIVYVSNIIEYEIFIIQDMNERSWWSESRSLCYRFDILKNDQRVKRNHLSVQKYSMKRLDHDRGARCLLRYDFSIQQKSYLISELFSTKTDETADTMSRNSVVSLRYFIIMLRG